jgi:cytochrome P450
MARAGERTKAVTFRKDFFYYLLKARDPETGESFPMTELWAETSLLIAAGSDTSSTTLAGTFSYLTHNASVLEKLSKEIRATFKDVEEIRSGSQLNSCVYLRVCIDETLRFSPPVGGYLPREVLAGGMTIDGHHLPEGTVVGCAAYAIHHNAAYFSDSFEYQPERWLKSSKEELERQQSAFCPFSLGPRGCIGRNMAYMELMTAVARAVWLYDLRLAGWLGEGWRGVGRGGRERREGEEGGRGRRSIS